MKVLEKLGEVFLIYWIYLAIYNREEWNNPRGKAHLFSKMNEAHLHSSLFFYKLGIDHFIPCLNVLYLFLCYKFQVKYKLNTKLSYQQEPSSRFIIVHRPYKAWKWMHQWTTLQGWVLPYHKHTQSRIFGVISTCAVCLKCVIIHQLKWSNRLCEQQ